MKLRALLVAAWACSALAAAAEPVRVLDEAIFERTGHPSQTVALPDTWAARGVPVATAGRYRIRFEQPGPSGPPLALMLTRLSSHHRAWLNGVLLNVEAPGPSGSNPAVPVATLIDLPPTLLRAGTNELMFDVVHSARGGLSPVEIGPKAVVRERFEAHRLRTVNLPQALNMAAAGLALLLLLLWWRRRSEVAFGAFGALALLMATRNYSYFLDTAIGSAVLGNWIMYASQLWGVPLLTLFAQAVAGRRWPRYTRALLAGAALLTLIGAWAIPAGHGLVLRAWVYPLLFAAAVPSLVLLLRAAMHRGGMSLALQAFGIFVLLAANARDLALLLLGAVPVTASYATPYVLPLALITVSLGLVERVVAALHRVEGLNTELEARVARRTRELEAANAAKTRFLAAASHDLRQPLVSIGLLVGLAREQASSAAQRAALQKADESVAAMESLLSSLLDLSRLEGGAVQVRLQPVALQAVFAAIEAQEAAAALRKGLRLRLRPTTIWVRTDPVLIERVLRNLVANAVRYTERGSVLVAARRRGGRVRVEVRDSGPGIAPQDQERIFDEFVQLASPQRVQGLGLGLTIVRRTLVLLEHPLALHSAPGRGSCFAVTLDPVRRPAIVEPVRAPVSANLAGRSVVVVEDDEVVRDALRARLQAWGAQVHAFDDLVSLRAWIDESDTAVPPDLAVCDFQLPSGTGIEAVAALRRRHGASLPAVLITGDTAPRDLAKLEHAELPVLHKPFRSESLMVLIERLLTPPAACGEASR